MNESSFGYLSGEQLLRLLHDYQGMMGSDRQGTKFEDAMRGELTRRAVANAQIIPDGRTITITLDREGTRQFLNDCGVSLRS